MGGKVQVADNPPVNVDFRLWLRYDAAMKMGAAWILLVAFGTGGMSQEPARITEHAIAGPPIHNGWAKAEDFLNMTSDQKQLYLMGLLDGIYIAPDFGAPPGAKSLVTLATCVEPMDASQITGIVELYIRQHPEQWHYDTKTLAEAALRQACHFVPEWWPKRNRPAKGLN